MPQSNTSHIHYIVLEKVVGLVSSFQKHTPLRTILIGLGPRAIFVREHKLSEQFFLVMINQTLYAYLSMDSRYVF